MTGNPLALPPLSLSGGHASAGSDGQASSQYNAPFAVGGATGWQALAPYALAAVALVILWRR